MGKNVSDRLRLRLRRKQRTRKNVTGSDERPRLSIHRSSRHVYAQVINDATGTTLCSVSSFENKGKVSRANKEKCAELGKELAAACKVKNIEKVVFDKNGYLYHGRLKAFADGAREAGLQF